MKVSKTKILATMMAFLAVACGQKEEDAGVNDSYTTIGGKTPVSGVPTSGTTVTTATQSEANSAAQSLGAVSGALQVNLDGEAASLRLTDGGDCDAGIFCIAQAFGMIADMVTGPAKCNFDLLLKDVDGNEVNPTKMPDRDVYYVDGLGTIGLSEDGVSCPTRQQVLDWGVQNGLKGGAASSASIDEDEFYPPTRLVLYKTSDDSFKWEVVFFPSDTIDAVVEAIPAAAGFKDLELDFKVFTGAHNPSTADEDKGTGSLTLDWDELARFIAAAQEVFPEEGDSDGGMPVGEINIAYDTTSDPVHLTYTFEDGFSFGDDDDSPFVTGVASELFSHSSGENYLMFRTTALFGQGEDSNGDGDYDDDGDDEGMGVHVCLDGDNSPSMISWGEIPESSYLADMSKTYFQIIWDTSEFTSNVPTKWQARMYLTEGDAYVSGPVWFDAGNNGEVETTPMVINLPKCSSITSTQLAQVSSDFNGHFGTDATEVVDGRFLFRLNLATSSGLSSDGVDAAMPSFTHLQMVEDPTAADIDPVVAE